MDSLLLKADLVPIQLLPEALGLADEPCLETWCENSLVCSVHQHESIWDCMQVREICTQVTSK